MSQIEKFIIRSIPKEQTKEWFKYKHYAKRIPSIRYSFGLYDGDKLIGVCTYGNPISKELCENVCGKKYKNNVLELNRLVVNENLPKNTLSYFVAHTFYKLPQPMIVVSYADTDQNHQGYIYQATNWIYTGLTKNNWDWKEKGTNKHSRTLGGSFSVDYMYAHPERFERIPRSRKHRYIMILASKRLKKRLINLLGYNIEPYPKGDNKRYDASHNTTTQLNMFNGT